MNNQPPAFQPTTPNGYLRGDITRGRSRTAVPREIHKKQGKRRPYTRPCFVEKRLHNNFREPKINDCSGDNHIPPKRQENPATNHDQQRVLWVHRSKVVDLLRPRVLKQRILKSLNHHVLCYQTKPDKRPHKNKCGDGDSSERN